MNSKATWLWTAIAAVLFAFLFFFEPKFYQPPPGPQKLLPSLNAAAVSSVDIGPRGPLEIRATRTNGGWQLTKPFAYPAHTRAIETLLQGLEQITPATYITAPELKNIRQADQKYGFEPPQKTIVVQQGDEQTFIHIGFRTAPGDQVFVQVVGIGEVYIVNADLLKLIPAQADDWRDRQLVDLRRVKFDRLLVTNSGKPYELQHNASNQLWRLILPGWEPRADSDKVEEAFQRLQGLHVDQFVSDDPKSDLDAFGLQSPEVSLAFLDGTNSQLVLQFGKSPTNNPAQIYARRADQNAVLALSRESLGPWPYENFRDRHLVSLTAPLSEIDVSAQDRFTLSRQTNGSWRVLPQGYPADPTLVNELITRLSELQVDFVKDAVTASDVSEKGLAPPLLQFILKSAVTNSLDPTNAVIAELDFGTNQAGKVFARRADESYLYTVPLMEVARLPSASWQMRERQIWDFTENDVAAIDVHQEGRRWIIARRGTNRWSLQPGSSGGMINDLSMEEVAHQLGKLGAASWVAPNDSNRAAYGFATNGHQLAIELKTGRKLAVEFGGTAPSGFPYALTVLDDQPWIFEFPWPLYQYVKSYLTIPDYIH